MNSKLHTNGDVQYNVNSEELLSNLNTPTSDVGNQNTTEGELSQIMLNINEVPNLTYYPKHDDADLVVPNLTHEESNTKAKKPVKSTKKTTIQKHNKACAGGKQFKCILCSFGCGWKKNLDQHMEIHAGWKQNPNQHFKCNLCEYGCIQEEDLERHVKVHMESKRNLDQGLNLNSVGNIISTSPILVGQTCLIIQNNKPLEAPDLTYYTKQDDDALGIHEELDIKTEVLDNLEEGTTEKLVKPTKKTGSQKRNKTHAGGERFKCKLCDFGCGWKKNLDKHMEIHTGCKQNSDPRYNCNLCAYECMRKDDFERHVKAHAEAKRDPGANLNSVENILATSFIPDEQKQLIKQKGRPTPDLKISCTSTSLNRTYNRVFNKNVYDKYEWMCGCPVRNKLFCFICLLFNKEWSAWTKAGVDDLKHLVDRARKHENSGVHISACLDFNVLGKLDIQSQLNTAYLQQKLKHNEIVEKNRHILRRLITCIKFCAAFELALRGHQQKYSPDIYVGLINFAAELDSALAIHMKDAYIFEGASKTIQNELLGAMFEVYRCEVIKEIKSANFIALEADETTDSSNQQQLVVIIRYVLKGKICERFWAFVRPPGYTADELANALLAELRLILKFDHLKLIAQSYDGASVMSDKNNGVQAIIRRTFPHAYFIHCYAHEFNLIMERAAQCHKEVKIFFANKECFSNFFSQRSEALEEVVKTHKVRNLKRLTVNVLFEHVNLFKICLAKIRDADGVDPKTITEACGLLNQLKCPKFLYWLKIFHFIMPHVEQFTNQAQAPKIERAVEEFETQIIRVRSTMCDIFPEAEEEPAKKRLKVTIARDVCDNILAQIKDRFEMKDHLSAAKLFESKNFQAYRRVFPQEYFDAAVKSYPVLDGAKLKNELTAIYFRDDMGEIDGVLSLLVFISDNVLKNVFTETYKLVDIICTTPMVTSECGRCFSTLKRIKTFLSSTITGDRLDALAVLSIEKKFVQSIPDFENKVVDVFCSNKNRRMDFLYK